MESASNKISLAYHNIFNYPLTPDELKRWRVGRKFLIKVTDLLVVNFQFLINKKQNFNFIIGRQKIIKTRLQNESYSKKKLLIAKKVAKIISKIPTVKFIGITGALAMMNAGKDSDIDLMIITKNNSLWLTRFLVYLLLVPSPYSLRRPKFIEQKDMLCINLWLDENDLVWDKADRNLYTAHEIAQVIPLVNKDKTYERFLYLNHWILTFWPNSVSMPHALSYKPYAKKTIKHTAYSIKLFEKLAFKLQYLYMKSKITREVVTPTRAIFHPNDWGKVVMEKLGIKK